jgi:hypothetical protein
MTAEGSLVHAKAARSYVVCQSTTHDDATSASQDCNQTVTKM